MKSDAWHGELREVWRLAWPLALVQLNNNLTGAVDTALAGRVDALTLGGTGLGASVFGALMVLSYGAGLGAEPLMAQAVGASAHGRARGVLGAGLRVAFVSSLPILLVGMVIALSLERLGVAPDVAAAGRTYLWGRLPALPACALVMVLRGFLQAHGATRAVLCSAVGMNGFNVVADWVLMFGDAGLTRFGVPALGIPALGILGIGIASAAAHFVQLAVLTWGIKVLQPAALAAPLASDEFWDAAKARAARRQIRRLGVPAAAHMFAEVGVFSLVALVAGGMGATVAAAHQTAIMVASLSFSVVVGVGIATGVHVAYGIGRGDPVGTRRAGLAGGVWGLGFMACTAVAMWLVPEALLAVLTNDPTVIPVAVPLLRIAGVFQIADGAQAVASGALRGAGSTRWAFGANMVAYWCIAVPCGILLTRVWHMGPAGLWWALTLGLCVAAVALCMRFWRLSARPIAALRV